MTDLTPNLATEVETLWLIALGLGVVVIVVVIALLTLLTKFVGDIDRGVRRVWETATRVAGNTASTWQLDAAVGAVGSLDAELAAHEEIARRT